MGIRIFTFLVLISIGATTAFANLPETIKTQEEAVEALNTYILQISTSAEKVERLNNAFVHGDLDARDMIKVEIKKIDAAISNSLSIAESSPKAIPTFWSRHTNAIRRALWWTSTFLLDAALIKTAIALNIRHGEVVPIFINVVLFSIVNGISAEYIANDGRSMIGGFEKNTYAHRLLAFIGKQHESVVKRRIIKYLEASLHENGTLHERLSLDQFLKSLKTAACTDALTLPTRQSKIKF